MSSPSHVMCVKLPNFGLDSLRNFSFIPLASVLHVRMHALDVVSQHIAVPQHETCPEQCPSDLLLVRVSLRVLSVSFSSFYNLPADTPCLSGHSCAFFAFFQMSSKNKYQHKQLCDHPPCIVVAHSCKSRRARQLRRSASMMARQLHAVCPRAPASGCRPSMGVARTSLPCICGMWIIKRS